jgi:hypothetical protein
VFREENQPQVKKKLITATTHLMPLSQCAKTHDLDHSSGAHAAETDHATTAVAAALQATHKQLLTLGASFTQAVSWHIAGEQRTAVVWVQTPPELICQSIGPISHGVAIFTHTPIQVTAALPSIIVISTQGVTLMRALTELSAVGKHLVVIRSVADDLAATRSEH